MMRSKTAWAAVLSLLAFAAPADAASQLNYASQTRTVSATSQIGTHTPQSAAAIATDFERFQENPRAESFLTDAQQNFFSAGATQFSSLGDDGILVDMIFNIGKLFSNTDGAAGSAAGASTFRTTFSVANDLPFILAGKFDLATGTAAPGDTYTQLGSVQLTDLTHNTILFSADQTNATYRHIGQFATGDVYALELIASAQLVGTNTTQSSTFGSFLPSLVLNVPSSGPTDGAVVPTPTAAVAGLVGLAALVCRRNRRDA